MNAGTEVVSGRPPLTRQENNMLARIIITAIFIASFYTLCTVAGCSASQPYGWPGVRLAEALNN
jgi:hypothetical protein